MLGFGRAVPQMKKSEVDTGGIRDMATGAIAALPEPDVTKVSNGPNPVVSPIANARCTRWPSLNLRLELALQTDRWEGYFGRIRR